MTTPNYYERQRGAAALAAALLKAGWTVYDYRPDQSDIMTDYYAPARWEGVARNGEFILVVNRDYGWNGTQQVNHAGRPARPVFSVPYAASTAGVTWLGNPPRYNWHLEYQGEIIAKGQGIGKAGGWHTEEQQRICAQILERIRVTIQGYTPANPESPTAEPGNPGNTAGVTVRHNLAHAGVEIRFPTKPDPDVLTRLKANGFRWSSPQQLWYARFNTTRWNVAQTIAAAG